MSAGFDSARGDPKVRDSFNLMTAEFLEKFCSFSVYFQTIVIILVVLLPLVFYVLLPTIVITLIVSFLFSRCK